MSNYKGVHKEVREEMRGRETRIKRIWTSTIRHQDANPAPRQPFRRHEKDEKLLQTHFFKLKMSAKLDDGLNFHSYYKNNNVCHVKQLSLVSSFVCSRNVQNFHNPDNISTDAVCVFSCLPFLLLQFLGRSHSNNAWLTVLFEDEKKWKANGTQY